LKIKQKKSENNGFHQHQFAGYWHPPMWNIRLITSWPTNRKTMEVSGRAAKGILLIFVLVNILALIIENHN